MLIARVAALLTALAPLAGCGVDFHPPRPGDTACLDDQVKDFGVPFYQAVQICGTPNPDLTGDTDLQQYAGAYDIDYRIQPALDAAIKHGNWREQLLVGSHIPEDYSLTNVEIDQR